VARTISPASWIARSPDARRRFANLVDVCWDRDIRLVVLATGSTDQILDEDVTDRDRMVSRLRLLRPA